MQREFWKDIGQPSPGGEISQTLLPTPNTVDAKGGNRSGSGQPQLCHLRNLPLISSVVAHPASLFRWRENAKQWPTSDGSGIPFAKWFKSSDRNTFWSKMSQGYCQQTLEGHLETFSGTWPSSGTMRRDVLPAAAFGAPHLRKRAFLVANANEKRLEGTKPQQERDLQLLGIGNQGILGAGWRSVEPTVRRGDHGVPFELDFIGRLNDEQSYDSEANATGIWTDIAIRFLRSVWEYQELAKASPELFQDRVLASVPEVSYGNTHGGWYVGARLEKDESLRDLWQEFYAFPLEGEIMLESLLKRIRQEKRKQAVENRVDRLRTLGNAVVPHVAEWIGRRIIRMDVK